MNFSKRRSIISVFFTAAVIVILSIFSASFYFRFDASAEQIHTISPASRRIIAGLTDSLFIRYYISPKLQDLSPVPQDIIDLLEEYVHLSNTKIELDVIDPSSPESAREARDYGIRPNQIQIIEDNQTSVATVYSGLVLIHGDEVHSFPTVFNPEVFEYQITSAVRRMLSSNIPYIGVLFGTEGLSLTATHTIFYEQLSRDYNVVELATHEPIPPEMGSVFLIGAADLDLRTISMLDDYLVAGGNIVAAVSPVEIDLDAGMVPVPLGESLALDWLSHHGALLEQILVLDQRNLSIPVEHNQAGIQYQLYQDYPHWIELSSVNANPEHVLTADFHGLDVFWPGLLRLVPGPFRTTEILLHSSSDSWIVGEPFYIDPQSAVASIDVAIERDGNYALAGEISGAFISFFTEDKISQDQAVDRDGRLLVISDSDFTSDLMQFAESWQNAQFLSFIADWASNDPDLMEIRSRTQRAWRLDRIRDQGLFQARARFVTLLHTIIIPLCIMLLAFFVLLPRSKDLSDRLS